MDLAKEATTYTYLTGRFPHQSSQGNKYVFAAYNYDGNAILTKAIPNREADTIIDAWKIAHYRLATNCIITVHCILDSERSTAFKAAVAQ